MGEKNSSDQNTESKQLQLWENVREVTVNTMQITAYVERICIEKKINLNVWSYDNDNLYPNKIRAIWQRSKSAKSASLVFSDFINGSGCYKKRPRPKCSGGGLSP